MLAILFDRSGTLTDMMQQVSWIHDKGQGERFTACKTQFGSIEAHIRIIACSNAGSWPKNASPLDMPSAIPKG
jgi:hypothetical protein